MYTFVAPTGGARPSVVLLAALLSGLMACSSGEPTEDTSADAPSEAPADVNDGSEHDAKDGAEHDAKSDSEAPPPELAAVYELSDEELHPESGDYDPVTRSFYVGSLGRGNVTRIGVDGTESIFFEGTGEPDRLTLGIRADSERRWLWVCSMVNDGIEPGTIWVFDLDDATMLHEFVLEDTFEDASCNDIDFDAQGRGYVTDRKNPNVYRIDLEEESVEIWAADEALAPELIGLNGVIVTPDQEAVLVSKYAPPRLLRISMDDPGEVVDVVFEGDAFEGTGDSPVSGADGLTMADDDFYVTFSDTMMRLDFDAQWREAEVFAQDMPSGLAAAVFAEGSLYAVKGEIVEFALELEVEIPFQLFRVDREAF